MKIVDMIFELVLDETKTMGSLPSSKSPVSSKKFGFGTERGFRWEQLEVGQADVAALVGKPYDPEA